MRLVNHTGATSSLNSAHIVLDDNPELHKARRKADDARMYFYFIIAAVLALFGVMAAVNWRAM